MKGSNLSIKRLILLFVTIWITGYFLLACTGEDNLPEEINKALAGSWNQMKWDQNTWQ